MKKVIFLLFLTPPILLFSRSIETKYIKKLSKIYCDYETNFFQKTLHITKIKYNNKMGFFIQKNIFFLVEEKEFNKIMTVDKHEGFIRCYAFTEDYTCNPVFDCLNTITEINGDKIKITFTELWTEKFILSLTFYKEWVRNENRCKRN